MTIRVGTSGFSYPEWRGVLYPEDLKPRDMLGFYATVFDAVELNSTFYRAPSLVMLDAWKRSAREGFRFALKASRYVAQAVHQGKTDRAAAFYTLVSRLGAALGPVLIQLPPVKKDAGALRAFLTSVPAHPTVFEFRHVSWFSDDVFELLSGAGCAMCITEADAIETPRVLTSRLAYVRLRAKYTTKALERWAREIREMDVDDAYVFFKHKGTLEGPALAKKMKKLLAP